MKKEIKLDYAASMIVLDALDDARIELETIEADSEWYTSGILMDRLEEARELLNLAIAEAGYDT